MVMYGLAFDCPIVSIRLLRSDRLRTIMGQCCTLWNRATFHRKQTLWGVVEAKTEGHSQIGFGLSSFDGFDRRSGLLDHCAPYNSRAKNTL